MQFFIAEFFSKLTLGERLKLQRWAKVNDLIVGLEISTNNFWTNIATGMMLTPLFSFANALRIMFTLTQKDHFQIWPYVNANLTLGQCQRRRNLYVKIYIIRLVLMGQDKKTSRT